MYRTACLVACGGLLCSMSTVPIYLVVLLTLFACVATSKKGRLIFRVFRRDVSAFLAVLKLKQRINAYMRDKKLLRDLVEEQVRKYGDKIAFVDADNDAHKLTYHEVQDLAHKMANIFLARGYKRGDVVGLFMENRVEYMSVWLGFSMIGVVTALINYNIRGDGLKHCIHVANCKAVIFSESLADAVKEVEGGVSTDFFIFNDNNNNQDNETQAKNPLSWERLGELLKSASTDAPSRSPEVLATDTLLYIYTSGTTGLPKAVVWSAMKNVTVALGWPMFYGLRETDIQYIALPLYHSLAMVFQNAIFFVGGTSVLKKKFSAGQYIEDCARHGVTVVTYIGEICRYLLAQPPKRADRTNVIRLAAGTGLRASIWNDFKERFGITNIIELYGSTEGNARPFPNVTGKVGAVGFIPLLFPNPDFKLIQLDEVSGEILRGSDGVALEAADGQPGEVVGRITEINKFDGYTDSEAKEKKIGRDIFERGDCAFLSGDIMVRDEEGYYFFRDRTGDTFRWKSENVSTNEVEGVISKIIQLTDVCVYAVCVPGCEGKAGMACIVDPHQQVDLSTLPSRLAKVLPRYAHPLFLRFSSSVNVTGTYKFVKVKLRREGYDPALCGGDRLYYFDRRTGTYLPLNGEEYKAIIAGDIAF